MAKEEVGSTERKKVEADLNSLLIDRPGELESLGDIEWGGGVSTPRRPNMKKEKEKAPRRRRRKEN